MNRTRPSAVQEITQVMVLETCVFGGVGIIILVLALFESQPFVGNFLCGGVVFLTIGITRGILAIGFYQLRPWAYPFVRVLEGTWWASTFGILAIGRGFGKKIKSPEVRAAFGLVPMPDEKTPNEEEPK